MTKCCDKSKSQISYRLASFSICSLSKEKREEGSITKRGQK